MQSLASRRRQWSIIFMIALLAVVGLNVQTISAAYRGCRADPIVWLSNGAKVQMTASVGANADAVERIVYTVHAPVGTTVTRTVYTGGPLSDKEEVVFVADLPAGQYTTDTVVSTIANGIDVTATTSVDATRASVSGLNNEHLVIHIKPGR